MSVPADFPYPIGQVVEIPIDQILENPKQPRRSKKKETIQELAASMKAKGQRTPVRVRPLTDEERAANPGNWVMHIGGHRRRAAAILNQWKTLKCIVDDIQPRETHHEAVLDNLHEDMDWWDWDVAIAIDHEDQPNMTQRELADWEGVSDSKVYNALKITKALNQASRALVDENLQKGLISDAQPLGTKNKGFLITESILLVLADLGDPAKVERALRKVFDEYLTEPETKGLVKWVKDGNEPESYNPHAKAVVPQQPAVTGQVAQTQGSSPAIDTQAEGPADPKVEPAEHTTRHNPSKTAKTQATLGEDLKQVWQGFEGAGVKAIFGKLAKNPWEAVGQILWKTLVTLWKLFWHMVGWVFKEMKKQAAALGHLLWSGLKKVLGPVVIWFLRVGAILLVVWLIWTYVFHPGDLVARLKGFIPSWSKPAPSAPKADQAPQTMAVTTLATVVKKIEPKRAALKTSKHTATVVVSEKPAPTPAAADSPKESAQPSLGSRLEGSTQAAGSPKESAQPSLGSRLEGSTQAAGSPKESAQPSLGSRLEGSTQAAPTLSPKDQAKVTAYQMFLKIFADDAFGPSYHDIPTWLANLKSEIVDGYQAQFFYENYPPAKIQEIQDKKWVAYFKPTQPPQWVGTDGASDQFLIEGVVITKSDQHYPGEVVSTQPIDLKVWVHEGAQGPQVTRVERVPTP